MEDAIALLRSDIDAFNQWRRDHAEVAMEFGAIDLQGLDLSGALLSGADLRGANLSHTLMMGAVLSGADLRDANLFNAELTGSIFGVPEVVPAELAASGLGDALTRPADASGASFVRATITEAQFHGVVLERADFTDANHADADMEGALLSGAILPAENSTFEERAWGAMRSLTFAQKRSYIQSLYTIACVDGDFDEEEQALMFAMAERMALSAEEFEACIPTEAFSPQDITIDAPADLEVRIQWLRNLLMMVVADGALATTEYQTCLYFAAQLGFPEEVVERVLASLT